MNLAHLTYFTTLANTRSYRFAALEASVSQSTLSTAISGLEKELGATLFIRKKGSVELTEEGRIFYQYVTSSLKFLDDGIRLVKEKSGNHVREITIGTVNTAQSRNWSELIYEFRKETHGEVQVKVKQGPTPVTLDLLKRGAVDVAFCGTMGKDPEVITMPCWHQEATLVVNKRHPLSKRKSISLRELRDHYLISYNLEGPIGKELYNLIHGWELQIDCLYGDEITLGSMVAANPDVMAIACNSWLLNAFESEVVLVPIEEAPENFHQLFFCFRSKADFPLVVKQFIDLTQRLYPISDAEHEL
ncbi:MAG: LysR family transcriptional regulator [Coriobacteriia bacterium]|nr:LysR family transcriptional regulator [Coriobacteriia bacterium]